MPCLSSFIILTVFCWLTCTSSYAALNISVTPTTGGNSLTFGRIDKNSNINKEVRVRVTSSDSKQYQIFQQLIEPLTNEQGQSLNFNAVSTYTLVGSNSSGTLYLQNLEPLGLNDQLIYTSASGGESDSLTIIYAVDPGQVSVAGNFMGKLKYVVRTIGSGEQDTVYLNVMLDVEGSFKVSVAGAVQKDTVRVSSDDRNKQSFAEISYSGNLGKTVKVYQEVPTFPQSEALTDLTRGVLLFSVDGGQQGVSSYLSPAPLDQKRVLLYTSSRSDDDLHVLFQLDPDVSDPTAGFYRGKVKYVIEVGGQEQDFVLNMEADIKPIFTLDVDLPLEGMRFDNLLPNNPPEYREVTAKVKSNLGKPYMVMQKVISPLTNQKGEQIPEGFFNIKEELTGSSAGQITHTDFKQVLQGEAPIFISDGKGSSAEFKVIYRLRADADSPSGDFQTGIVYTLGEM